MKCFERARPSAASNATLLSFMIVAAAVIGPPALNAQQPAATVNAAAAQTFAQTQMLPLLQLQMPTAADLNEASRALRQAVRRSLVSRATVDPQSAGGEGAAQHQLTIVAEKGDVNGRARFYLPVNDKSDLVVTFTSPLSSGNATLATDTGLGRNVSVNAGLKLSFWSYTDAGKTSQNAAPSAGRQYLQGIGSGLGLPSDNVAAALEALRRVAVATQ